MENTPLGSRMQIRMNLTTGEFCCKTLVSIWQSTAICWTDVWPSLKQSCTVEYLLVIYRLTHSASELSRLTCTSSQTVNEKFRYRTRFIVSERIQVSRAMSALTLYSNWLHCTNTALKPLWLSQPKPWCNDSGVLSLHHSYYTTITTSRWLSGHNPVSRGTYKPANQKFGICTVRVHESWIITIHLR